MGVDMPFSNAYAATVGRDFDPDPENNVFGSLFEQYERVVFQSLITSFGLDGFVKDRLGGDVDTVHTVRQGEAGGGYKNAANAAAYENRGPYDSAKYHSDKAYIASNKAYSKQRAEGTLEDAYTGKGIAPNEKYHQDHVIAAKEVHDDPGRVLSGLDGVELANAPENLKATNPRTNQTKKADTMDDFLEKYGDAYTDEQKERMRRADKASRESYNRKIQVAYYTSPGFWKDSGVAAAKVGGGMALRQALGFVLTEVWFAVKERLASAANSLEAKLHAIAEGIQEGVVRAKDNFKALLSKVGEGAVSGILSSLTTTLCNVFFTSAKNVVRIIRQTWVSLVQAAKILLINPDNLPFSERMRSALQLIASGASVVLGTIVQEAVHKGLAPHIAAVPMGSTIQSVLSIFCGTLCTGFLTVSLLYFIDSDPFDGFLMKAIDGTIVEYKRQAQLFEAYAAKLAGLDIATFERESALYHALAFDIASAEDDDALHALLTKAMETIGVAIPWGDDRPLDDFMQDRTAVLRFNA